MKMCGKAFLEAVCQSTSWKNVSKYVAISSKVINGIYATKS